MKKLKSRRDFIYTATSSCAAFGAVAITWPLISSFNPAKDTSAKNTGHEVEFPTIKEGEQHQFVWRKKLITIKHRTQAEIKQAEKTPLSDLISPETDQSRLRPLPNGDYNPRYIVLLGACTRNGCIPVINAGDYDGWYCPCCGSHYDTSGRIRKGPAPSNIAIPHYQYISDTMIRIHESPILKT